MFELFFGNPHYKLAALLTALAAWLFVQSDEVHPEPITVRVQWSQPAPGLVAVDGLPNQITLQVEGTRAALRRAHRADVSVVADITGIGAGQHALEFAPMPVQGLPSGIEVRGHAPSGVRFELDRVAERRIEIEPNVVGQPELGFSVAKVTVLPAVITVRGARTKLDTMDAVRTEPIDVSGLDRATELPVALALPAGIEPAEALSLVASVDILALNEQRTFGEVPVHVWQSTAYAPSTPTAQVVLRGPAATLRKLSPEDVTVFLHAETPPRTRVLHAGGPEVRVTVVNPQDIRLVPR